MEVSTMKPERENRYRVLDLLCENLSNPHPQVMSIETIAMKLHLSVKEARELLLRMGQTGEIQSTIEGNHSLITPAGLEAVNTRNGVFHGARSVAP